ncbi:hypothetical protein TREMEDRAFT_59615 [Tremella mesenterica DSM 1558]|uniref:uncharacterized protein n=1 Tax=Tremella mesenterica (strain ATCC 24925 / CBS 8224 / DSM 1558 / NBRC 9311 / NRRL Y-6157 / RJB 2259-6 / UBC 559-6) TaxID=578456 RepID=UPI0003F493F1|nr:uncharacterized protein TREMEDRAFT_59615 [Tremella mesenterica DSM 1558]EIW73446.1 hypothetical protein TREMEDRAFT_59615 [Tremella mesenterica DSM 1558]
MATQHQGSMPTSHFQDPSTGGSTPMPFLGDMLAGGSFKGLAVNIKHWTPKHPYKVISATPDGSMKTFVYHFPKFARISETTGKLPNTMVPLFAREVVRLLYCSASFDHESITDAKLKFYTADNPHSSEETNDHCKRGLDVIEGKRGEGGKSDNAREDYEFFKEMLTKAAVDGENGSDEVSSQEQISTLFDGRGEWGGRVDKKGIFALSLEDTIPAPMISEREVGDIESRWVFGGMLYADYGHDHDHDRSIYQNMEVDGPADGDEGSGDRKVAHHGKISRYGRYGVPVL